jgi:hypothetical protein
MRTLLLALALFIPTAHAENSIKLGLCHGAYALCAASATEPTGETIYVNGVAFAEGTAVCPVLQGISIGNLSLMNGSCEAPGKGVVWSLFSTIKSYPQAPSWAVAPAVIRTFVTTAEVGGGMSNMWSFPCTVRPNKVNGVTLSDCKGPMNESPWTATWIPVGTTIGTAAPVGANNPVGGNFP